MRFASPSRSIRTSLPSSTLRSRRAVWCKPLNQIWLATAHARSEEDMMAARLPYLDREQVPPDVQAVYDTMKKATGRVLNTFRLMAHHARSVAPVVAWYGTLREGALDLKLRQLAYVKASQINGCNY